MTANTDTPTRPEKCLECEMPIQRSFTSEEICECATPKRDAAQTPSVDATMKLHLDSLTVKDLTDMAEVHPVALVRGLARELAAVRGQLAEYEFAAEHDEFDERGVSIIDLGNHYTDALMALTERKAYSKSSCAQMIAEQSARAERAESALAAAKAEADALREDAERYQWLKQSHWYVGLQPDGNTEGVDLLDYNEKKFGLDAAIDAARKGE